VVRGGRRRTREAGCSCSPSPVSAALSFLPTRRRWRGGRGAHLPLRRRRSRAQQSSPQRPRRSRACGGAHGGGTPPLALARRPRGKSSGRRGGLSIDTSIGARGRRGGLSVFVRRSSGALASRLTR
jgi:hypothetical protein